MYCISYTDLLEKSRVTYQMPGVERNYHIFYWLLTGKYPDYAGKYWLLTGKYPDFAGQYWLLF